MLNFSVDLLRRSFADISIAEVWLSACPQLLLESAVVITGAHHTPVSR